MKPILIDSIYINMGGALTVLNRLIEGVVEANLDFVLLKDNRCPKLKSEDGVRKIISLPPSLMARHKFYNAHKNDFHSVLCMSNLPPSIKMPCKVHTYFHNLSVLVTPRNFKWKDRIKFIMKRRIIAYFAKNTDSWIVQTWHTQNVVKDTLPWKGKSFYCYPIFTIPDSFKATGNEFRTDYIFVGSYTHAKGHDELLEAWRLLHKEHVVIPLHLTIWDQQFIEKIEVAIAEGVDVVNHGKVSFEQLGALYKRSKVLIYPSLNESLGLGIVEGLYAGCDIIASDLPFTHAICKPSEVFDPLSPRSIADAVKRYEMGQSRKSELTIHDSVEELINLIKA